MRIYLCGSYDRREEFDDYAAGLTILGHEVTARWLEGNEDLAPERQAQMDITDLLLADCLVTFTYKEGEGPSRGGRHVEFGIAWYANKRMIVVGPRENIFHHLPEVECFADWPEAFAALAEENLNGVS